MSRRESRAEKAIVRYLMLKTALENPRGISLDCDVGLQNGKNCSYCGAKSYTFDKNTEICAKCGEIWPKIPIFRQKGEYDANIAKNDGKTENLIEMANLGIKIALALKKDKWGVTVLWLWVAENRGGIRGIATYATEHFPEAPFVWNKDKVWRLLRSGILSLEKELGDQI